MQADDAESPRAALVGPYPIDEDALRKLKRSHDGGSGMAFRWYRAHRWHFTWSYSLMGCVAFFMFQLDFWGRRAISGVKSSGLIDCDRGGHC